MSLNQNLTELFRITVWRVSKQGGLPFKLIQEPLDDGRDWLIPCKHFIQPSISDVELENLIQSLPVKIPGNLIEMLRSTNGAELFCIEQDGGWGETNLLSRINLLSGFEILYHYIEQFSTYLSYVDNSTGIDGLPWQLNYLAFADVRDGNFLAIDLEDGGVFILDHEMGYFPIGYESKDRDFGYKRLADSLESWLALIVGSEGKHGMGRG